MYIYVFCIRVECGVSNSCLGYGDLPFFSHNLDNIFKWDGNVSV